MRLALSLALIAISAHSYAGTTDPAEIAAMQRANYCGNLGQVYEIAAHVRDTGYPPEEALNRTRLFKTIPIEAQKKAINQVFFDRDFAYAGGSALSYQVTGICMHGPKNYKPLK